MKPILTSIFCVAALVATSCATAVVPQKSGLTTGAPGRNVYPTNEPGTSKVLPRAYPTAPPNIPHSIADQYITRKLNDCFECHVDGEEVEAGHTATKIPASHYRNVFTGEQIEKKPEHVVGIRNNCLQCHVPQAEGLPLPVAVRP